MTDAIRRVVTRRAVFALAAGACVCVAGTAQAAGLPVRAIRVSGTANRDLARLAPMVQQALARQLGARYAPGVRGGATLIVELTDLDLPVRTGGGGGGRGRFHRSGDGSVDVLEGRIALVGAKGVALQEFPLLAQTGSTDASDIHPFPTDARLASLAYTYSYWVVSKLD